MYTVLAPNEHVSADVLIIGAGVSGCSIARALSAYRLDVVLVDALADVCFSTSKANSGIIHGGFHHNKKHLKTRLEIEGNALFDRLHRELGFPFERCGIIVAAIHEDEVKQLDYLYRQGLENGSRGIQMCSRSRIHELEPNLHPDAAGGLYAPAGGIIEPYRFGFALAESAQKNGVRIVPLFRAVRAEHGGSSAAGPGGAAPRTRVYREDGASVSARWVVNAAGLYADEISRMLGGENFTITPRKGEYFLLDKATAGVPSHVVFPVPNSISKGILVIPTVEGTVLVGPTASDGEDKEDTSTNTENLEYIFDSARRLVPSISLSDIITSFAGIRATLPGGDFYIERSKLRPNLIQVAGIQSPGLTASPAIGYYVKDLLARAGCELIENPSFDPLLDPKPEIRNRSSYEAEELTIADPAFCRIVCRCEKVSEAEIRRAIREGHTTLDGIRYATRAGAGRCQGGFCSYRTIKLIGEETGIPITEVTKNGPGSELFPAELGGRDD